MREFKIPDEPTDVKRVQAMDGSDEVFTYDPRTGRGGFGDWFDPGGTRWTWGELLNEWGGVIELDKTPAEKAVEFFAEYDLSTVSDLYHNAPIGKWQTAVTALVNHAKENG